MNSVSPHLFHIPVMGLAFTIDTPIKVACYGINSSISIIEDHLIEKMRAFYYKENKEAYVPITKHEDDFRAKRITDYLNLVNREVKKKITQVKTAAFEKNSEITKYFELLPDQSDLKKLYSNFLKLTDSPQKREVEKDLRESVKPGAIEVNIMTKVDKETHDKNGEVIVNGSDALQALKGYAESDLENSTLVFSAGMNPRLFNYLGSFDTFQQKTDGEFQKAISIKVSDYRSALIQGKYLAKRGIWVSEYRIESGLNCGGHAFATEGFLLGPILAEFEQKKEALTDELSELYRKSFSETSGNVDTSLPEIKITVQGGIGTFEEDQFLKSQYKVQSTGWGTPFLLCPETTNVDDDTLDKLKKARKEDIVLSHSSPLGVRFQYLKGTSAELYRKDRLAANKLGSSCPEKLLISNTEFTKEPICMASTKYQKLKYAQLKESDLPEKAKAQQIDQLLQKECLCTTLCNSVAKIHDFTFVKNLNSVTVCPGPNLAYFSAIYSLKELADHIYGRINLLKGYRPHMFIKELQLYVDQFKELGEGTDFSNKRALRNYKRFLSNLKDGIDYYKELYHSKAISDANFLTDLWSCEQNILKLDQQPVS